MNGCERNGRPTVHWIEHAATPARAHPSTVRLPRARKHLEKREARRTYATMHAGLAHAWPCVAQPRLRRALGI